MTERTEETPEMPAEVRVAFEALESNGRMKAIAEVAEKMQEMGLKDFPAGFVTWLMMEALDAVKQRIEGERIMDIMTPDKASDAA